MYDKERARKKSPCSQGHRVKFQLFDQVLGGLPRNVMTANYSVFESIFESCKTAFYFLHNFGKKYVSLHTATSALFTGIVGL